MYKRVITRNITLPILQFSVFWSYIQGCQIPVLT